MRIAVDAREIEGRPTGVGRVLAGLLRAWPPADEIILISRSPIDARLLRPGWSQRTVTGPRRLPGALWEQFVLPRVIRSSDVSALLSPAYGMPALSPVPVVVGMHDCAAEALPLTFGFRERWRRRLVGRMAARRAAYLFMGSDFAASEARRWLPASESRLAVVPYGVAPEFGAADGAAARRARERYGLCPRTVLFVGSQLPRRDLAGLARTVAGLARTRPDVGLCIVGPRPAGLDHTGAVDDAGARWLGYVAEEQLPGLYAAATVLAYPSTYEGFGLPVLEALACGTPVVAASSGSLGEIFGEHAWLVDQDDRDGWEAALECLLDDDDERAARTALSAPWARARTWDDAASRVRGLLASAARGDRGV